MHSFPKLSNGRKDRPEDQHLPQILASYSVFDTNGASKSLPHGQGASKSEFFVIGTSKSLVCAKVCLETSLSSKDVRQNQHFARIFARKLSIHALVCLEISILFRDEMCKSASHM